MKQIIEHWDGEKGVASCIIQYKTTSGVELQGIGIAQCAPQDTEFKSALTGGLIAEYRAEIDLFKKINNYEIKPAITALKHVYCTMRHSKQYDPKSYEAVRLKKELAHLMDEFEENKNSIKELKQNLSKYIQEKDDFYRKLEAGQK